MDSCNEDLGENSVSAETAFFSGGEGGGGMFKKQPGTIMLKPCLKTIEWTFLYTLS